MKICAACEQELPQTSFSKNQWKLKQYQRRCKECIDANQAVQLTAPPKTESTATPSRSLLSTEDEGPTCWICLEEGPNEFGQPLRRDCSCRGESAGFAHLSCVIGYAEVKSRSAARIEEFIEPWKCCPSCKQSYQNEVALDLADGFVTFVEGAHPNGQYRQLRALYLKFEVLMMLDANLQPTRKDEAKQLGVQVISKIEQMRVEGSSIAMIGSIEAHVYTNLGIIANGTKDGARTALGYFEKARDICQALGDTDRVAMAESIIAASKVTREGVADERVGDMLEKHQKLYIQFMKKYGRENSLTLEVGRCYALALYKTSRMIEAERLYTRLAASYRRVHGPDHHLTKESEFRLDSCKVRQVAINYQGKWEHFQALRYDEDGKKCVVQGPLQGYDEDGKKCVVQGQPINTQGKTITVDTENILCHPGTPVVCHGLEGVLEYLNGKIVEVQSVNPDTGSYEVEVHLQVKGACTVHHKNTRILFEFPNE